MLQYLIEKVTKILHKEFIDHHGGTTPEIDDILHSEELQDILHCLRREGLLSKDTRRHILHMSYKHIDVHRFNFPVIYMLVRSVRKPLTRRYIQRELTVAIGKIVHSPVAVTQLKFDKRCKGISDLLHEIGVDINTIPIMKTIENYQPIIQMKPKCHQLAFTQIEEKCRSLRLTQGLV